MKKRLHWGMLLLWLAALAPARAADPVTQAMTMAYAPYRTALFQTNGKAQVESEQAIAQARQAWEAIAQRFAAAPPTPYAQDAEFSNTLAQVNQVLKTAQAQIRERQLPLAHETLEQVRDLLAGLRQRSGVVVMSDHMNAYHEQMEHLLKAGPGRLEQRDGTLLLMADVGILEHLATRLASQAAAPLREDAEFQTLQRAVAASVADLRSAVLAQDTAAIRRALGALKKPYSRLFLKFG